MDRYIVGCRKCAATVQVDADQIVTDQDTFHELAENSGDEGLQDHEHVIFSERIS